MRSCVRKHSARSHGSVPGSIGQEESVSECQSECVLFKFSMLFRKVRWTRRTFRGRSLAANMTSSADVDSWKALGGRVDQSSGSWYTATGKPDLSLSLSLSRSGANPNCEAK